MIGRDVQIRAALFVCCLLARTPAHGQAPPSPPTDARAGISGDRAAARYKQSLDTNPTEGTALDRLWNLAGETGKTAALLDEYATRAKSDIAPALVHGHLLKKAGRPDEAAAAYGRAAALAPADPRPHLALADLEKQRGRHAAAAIALEVALTLLPPTDGRRPDVFLALGTARLAAGDADRAAEAWEETVRAAPRNLAARERLAETYENHSLPERAVPHQEWIEGHATDPAARAAAGRALGRLHEARGDFEAARAALERARGLTAPGNWLRGELSTALIRLHERAGRVPELEASWRAAAEKAPRDLGAWLSLVELYAATAQSERERAALERALGLTPRDRELSLRLARLCADAGNLDRATTILDSLLKIQPGNFELVLERAHLDLRAGRLAEAAARVEAAARSRPGDDAIAGGALAFFQANRLHDATERALRAEIARRPDAPEPPLALAGFLFNEKRPAEALATLDAFIVPKPGSSDARNAASRADRCARAAELLKGQNRLDDALRFAKSALALQPENTAFRLALGDLELLRGEPAAARAAFAAVADTPTAATDVREAAEQKLFAACRASPGPASASANTNSVASAAMPRRVPLPAKTGTLLGPPVVMRAEPRFHVGVGVAGSPRPRGSIGRSAVSDDEPPAVLERAIELEAAAQAEPTAANFLRLARWQSWRRALPDALLAAQAAANAEPGSVPAHEWVVRLATETRDRTAAAAGLATLAKLDSTNAPRYHRQAGHLKLDAGEIDAAVALFSDLADSDPASRENLSALALAQQRAARWLDAAGTWERAYRLPAKGSPTARTEVRSALLGALEHTGQHNRAIELLSAAAAEEGAQPTARRERFRDLLAYARKHGQLEAVERAHAARLAAHPQDPALLAETAALHRARGRPREAYALLERALPGSSDLPGALRELVSAAEESGAFHDAIRHQRRLLQLDPTTGRDAAGWEKLAALEVANLDLNAATRTWNGIAARFPRDPEILTRAEAFFETVADEPALARETLRKVVLIDPNDLARQLHLGRLELGEGGDRNAALRAFEAILRRTELDKTSDASARGNVKASGGGDAAVTLPAITPPDRRPGLTRVRASPKDVAGSLSSAMEEPAIARDGGDSILRLLAIGEISDELRLHPAPRQPWIARWRTQRETAPLEALWAFYYADESALALDVLERQLLPAQPDDPRLQRWFLDLVFNAGDHVRLARWLRPENPAAAGTGNTAATVDREARARRLAAACEALARYVPTAETDTLDPVLLNALFPESGTGHERELPRERLWQAATQVLAPAGRLAEAVRLGERVFASSVTGRAACGLQLARWHVTLRQSERARAVLRASFETITGPVDDKGGLAAQAASDNDDAAFADECLRAYYLLLPAEERAPFRERFTRDTLAALAGGRHDRSPAQRWLSLVLLDGLAGDWAAGRAHLDRLLAFHPLSERAIAGSGDPAATRRWSYRLEVGERLGNWGFDPLTEHLWKRTLADPALAGLGADAALRSSALREGRIRLAILQLNAAPGDLGRADTVLRDLLALDAPPEARATLRTRLGAGTGSVPAKAERLASIATLPVATRLAEELCAREPDSAEHWRALLNAYTTAEAIGPLERTLRQLLFQRLPERAAAGASTTPPRSRGGAPVPRRELALRLADVLENAGDLAGAARVLEIVHQERRDLRPHENPPGPARDFSLPLRLAANLEKQGKFSDAACWCRDVLDADPSAAAAALSLARLEGALGHPDKAMTALENAFAAAEPRFTSMPVGGIPPPPAASGPPRAADDLVVALAKRHVEAGGSDRALSLARSCLRSGRLAPVQEIAVALAKSSTENGPAARSLFDAVVRGSREPQARVAAQAALLQHTAPSASEEPAAFARQLGRLRRLTSDTRFGASVAWQTARFDLFVRAGRAAELEKTLRDEWADGRGDRASGAKLALLLARADPARTAELTALVQAITASPQLDEEATGELLTTLEKAEHHALCLPLAARMSRRFPHNTTLALQHARLLWRAERTGEAEALLASLEAGAVFNAGLPALVAALWRADLGEPERARNVLLRAVMRDPGVSRAGAPLRRALARAEITGGKLDAARKLLREADVASAGSFTSDDLEVALDYLEARGQLVAAASPGTAMDLGLPATMGPRLASAAFTRLWDSGRVEDARALVSSRPALLGEVSGLAFSLRSAAEKHAADTSGGDRRWLIEQLERALAAAGKDPAIAVSRLTHELAAALDAAATAELAMASDTDAAADDQPTASLNTMRRACELEPAHLPRVRRLGELLVARGERTAAVALARDLIAAPDAAPSDKETVRELMQSWGAEPTKSGSD